MFEYGVLWYNVMLQDVLISNIRGREVIWVRVMGWCGDEEGHFTANMKVDGKEAYCN